jgi:hypothetical protein
MMATILDKVVLVAIAEVRQIYIESIALEANEDAGHASSADEQHEPPACLSFDGEAQFLTAAMNRFTADKNKLKTLICLKYPAACSKTLQPAVVSPSFMVMKQRMKKLIVKHPLGYKRTYMTRVSKLLKSMESKSARLFARWISLMETVLSDSFTETNVARGWQNSGLVPLNSAKLVAACYSGHDLTPAQKEACYDAIKKLAPSFLQYGQVRDHEIQTAVGSALQFTARYMMNAVESVARICTKWHFRDAEPFY